jgi:hypothetical protein
MLFCLGSPAWSAISVVADSAHETCCAYRMRQHLMLMMRFALLIEAAGAQVPAMTVTCMLLLNDVFKSSRFSWLKLP